MVLRATIKPFASNETTAVLAVLGDGRCRLISPEIFSNQMPLPAAAGDFAIDNADVAATNAMDKAAVASVMKCRCRRG